MNQTDELLFKKLRELIYQKNKFCEFISNRLMLKNNSKINVKIITVATELVRRGYNPEVNIKSDYSPILGQKITIEPTLEIVLNNKAYPRKIFDETIENFDTDHSKPFEDEGAPDDDFID